MQKSPISTTNAPAAVGPYHQAIMAGGFVFLSGQLAIDPATGQFDTTTDTATQMVQVLANLDAVLTEAGLDWSDVVRSEIFLTDMQDYAAINALYAEKFVGIEPPARQCIAVAGLPLGGKVEISLIAQTRA